MICFDTSAGIRSIDMECIEVGTYSFHGAEVLRRAVNLRERGMIPVMGTERKRYL